MIDRAALERDLTAARGGRRPPAGLLDVVVEEICGERIARPRDWELLCERGGESPFWATVWPSGEALARAVAADPARLRGRRVLELGCGLALPSVVAARGGADVLATDASAAAVVFARLNLALAAVAGEAAVLDVRSSPDRLGRVDAVLAADVVYDRRNVEPLLALLPAVLEPGGLLWLADPGRPGLEPLLAGLPDGLDVRVERAEHLSSV